MAAGERIPRGGVNPYDIEVLNQMPRTRESHNGLGNSRDGKRAHQRHEDDKAVLLIDVPIDENHNSYKKNFLAEHRQKLREAILKIAMGSGQEQKNLFLKFHGLHSDIVFTQL